MRWCVQRKPPNVEAGFNKHLQDKRGEGIDLQFAWKEKKTTLCDKVRTRLAEKSE